MGAATPASPIPNDAFRACVGEFATGVTVVASEHDGVRAGMTLNAFISVSLDPLMVLVSLAHGTRTLGVVRQSGRFGVSVLHREQREAAIELATPGAPFPEEHMTRTADGFVIVRGAAATQHCEVEQVTVAGDHELVLGRVVGLTHNGGEPLIFHRGRFGGMVVDALVPPAQALAIEEGAGW
jgi:3-hydroxy-9,10-secoandrosta-1,3,5(10)-triene-9,17-dione monooxygenase reductase component